MQTADIVDAKRCHIMYDLCVLIVHKTVGKIAT